MFRKKKNLRLKIFISSLFHGKKSWNLMCKFKYGFSIALCKKKTAFFDFKKKKKVFWDLKNLNSDTISSIDCKSVDK